MRAASWSGCQHHVEGGSTVDVYIDSIFGCGAMRIITQLWRFQSYTRLPSSTSARWNYAPPEPFQANAGAQ
jgi:hypothetical protein